MHACRLVSGHAHIRLADLRTPARLATWRAHIRSAFLCPPIPSASLRLGSRLQRSIRSGHLTPSLLPHSSEPRFCSVATGSHEYSTTRPATHRPFTHLTGHTTAVNRMEALCVDRSARAANAANRSWARSWRGGVHLRFAADCGPGGLDAPSRRAGFEERAGKLAPPLSCGRHARRVLLTVSRPDNRYPIVQSFMNTSKSVLSIEWRLCSTVTRWLGSGTRCPIRRGLGFC